MSSKVIVSNIQRFSLTDGEGIRTTVFLKGCSLKCPWCANPENINHSIERYHDADNNKDGVFGREMTIDEIYSEVVKDKVYYDNGGVTFSGGEPLLWINEYEELLKRLKDENINICFETSLFVKKEYMELALKYADSMIVDLKILDSDLTKNVLMNNLSLYLDNIETLFKIFDPSKIVIRIPVSNEYVISNSDKYVDFIKKYTPKRVELFKLHNLGEKKYLLLGLKMNKYEEVSDSDLDDFKNKLESVCETALLKF